MSRPPPRRCLTTAPFPGPKCVVRGPSWGGGDPWGRAVRPVRIRAAPARTAAVAAVAGAGRDVLPPAAPRRPPAHPLPGYHRGPAPRYDAPPAGPSATVRPVTTDGTERPRTRHPGTPRSRAPRGPGPPPTTVVARPVRRPRAGRRPEAPSGNRRAVQTTDVPYRGGDGPVTSG